MYKLWFILITLVYLFLSSCTVKHDFSGLKPGQWYVSQDINVAIRFNNLAGRIFGDYVITDGCYSDLYKFECDTKRRKVKFIFKLHSDIKLYGLEFTNKSGLTLHASERIEYNFSIEQNAAFEGKKRYLEPVFDDISVTEVIYGKASGFYSSKRVSKVTTNKYPEILANALIGISDNVWAEDIELAMDIYQPRGDESVKRPLLLMIHGGAFIVGDKRDEFNVRLAEYYARCGYVVASINYRIGFVFIPGMYTAVERAMYRATQDARAALRFLIDNQYIYGINPKFCFVGGNSAGGFISLFAAFMEEDEKMQSTGGNIFRLQGDLGCLDCSGNAIKHNFNIRGVVNMWGGITDLEMIDDYEKIPVLLIHGDNDQVIPINYDYPFSNVNTNLASLFTRKVYGSKPVYDKMRELSFDVELYNLPGEGHEPYEDENQVYNENYYKIKTKILNFFAGEIKNVDFVINRSLGINQCIYNVSSANKVNWHAKGGIILGNKGNEIQVVWISSSSEKSVTAYEVDEMGYINIFELIN